MCGFPVLQFSSLPHQAKAFSAFLAVFFSHILCVSVLKQPYDLANEITHVSLVADYKRQGKIHIY